MVAAQPIQATQTMKPQQTKPLKSPITKTSVTPRSTTPLVRHPAPTVIANRATRLLSPILFPRAPDKPPKAPSLRSSLLPTPCAEIDERPRSRIRRFKLWKEQAPEMRICVLDPKKRWNLRRWQTFAIPSSVKVIVKGNFRRNFPLGPNIPREPFGVLPPTPLSQTSKPIKPASISTRIPRVHSAAPVKLNRAQRHAQRERLKQHKWVLDVEYERRFRTGLREIMDMVLQFQENLLIWDPSTSRYSWKEEPDLIRIENYTQLFKDTRKSTRTIFDIYDILPVPGRDEAKRELQADEDGRRQRKQARQEKRLRKDNQAANHPQVKSPVVPLSTQSGNINSQKPAVTSSQTSSRLVNAKAGSDAKVKTDLSGQAPKPAQNVPTGKSKVVKPGETTFIGPLPRPQTYIAPQDKRSPRTSSSTSTNRSSSINLNETKSQANQSSRKSSDSSSRIAKSGKLSTSGIGSSSAAAIENRASTSTVDKKERQAVQSSKQTQFNSSKSRAKSKNPTSIDITSHALFAKDLIAKPIGALTPQAADFRDTIAPLLARINELTAQKQSLQALEKAVLEGKAKIRKNGTVDTGISELKESIEKSSVLVEEGKGRKGSGDVGVDDAALRSAEEILRGVFGGPPRLGSSALLEIPEELDDPKYSEPNSPQRRKKDRSNAITQKSAFQTEKDVSETIETRISPPGKLLVEREQDAVDALKSLKIGLQSPSTTSITSQNFLAKESTNHDAVSSTGVEAITLTGELNRDQDTEVPWDLEADTDSPADIAPRDRLEDRYRRSISGDSERDVSTRDTVSTLVVTPVEPSTTDFSEGSSHSQDWSNWSGEVSTLKLKESVEDDFIDSADLVDTEYEDVSYAKRRGELQQLGSWADSVL